MTINEYQPLQLGVYANGADLQNVVVSVSPFTDSSGRVVEKRVFILRGVVTEVAP